MLSTCAAKPIRFVILAALVHPLLAQPAPSQPPAETAAHHLAREALGRVASLLDDLRARAEGKGREDQTVSASFVAWCSEIQEMQTKMAQSSQDTVLSLHPRIEDTKSQLASLAHRLQELQEEVSDNEQALRGAVEIRHKETSAFDRESSEITSSLASLDKAIEVLQGSSVLSLPQLRETASLVQSALLPVAHSDDHVKHFLRDENLQLFLLQARGSTSAASLLQSLSGKNQQPANSGADETASGVESEDAAPPGPNSEIEFERLLSVLADLRASLAEDLKSSQDTEQQRAATYNSLYSSKTREVAAGTSEMQRLAREKAEMEVQMRHDEHDFADAQSSLIEAEAFLKDLRNHCASGEQGRTERADGRLQELTALSEAAHAVEADLEAINADVAPPSDIISPVLATPADGAGQLSAGAGVLSFLQKSIESGTPGQRLETEDELMAALGGGQGRGAQDTLLASVISEAHQQVAARVKSKEAGGFMQRRPVAVATTTPAPLPGALRQLQASIEARLAADPRNTQLVSLASQVGKVVGGKAATGLDFRPIGSAAAKAQQSVQLVLQQDGSHLSWCEASLARSRTEVASQKELWSELSTRVTSANEQLQSADAEAKGLNAALQALAADQQRANAVRASESQLFEHGSAELGQAELALSKATKVMELVYPQIPELSHHADAIVPLLQSVASGLSKQVAQAKTDEDAAAVAFERITRNYGTDARLKQRRLVFLEFVRAKLASARNDAESELEDCEDELVVQQLRERALHDSCDTLERDHVERARQLQVDISSFGEVANAFLGQPSVQA